MKMVGQKFDSIDAVKDEEYRFWATVSPAKRLGYGHQMSVEGYAAAYGHPADGQQLKRVAVRLEQETR